MLQSNLHQAQYANRYAAYGQIQYGNFGIPIQNYGGWPKQEVILKPIADPAYEPITKTVVEVANDNVAEHSAIIRKLREQLAQEEDFKRRQMIRAELEKAKQEKERAYRLKAILDEEEAAFILLGDL